MKVIAAVSYLLWLLAPEAALAALDLLSFLPTYGFFNAPYGTCGDCYCATGGEVPECPGPGPPPSTDFADLLPVLMALTWANPITIDCDPYTDEFCDTTPPMEKGGACILELIPEVSNDCPVGWSYSTSTYSGTAKEALEEGLYVTHEGACGTCSSLQDLAAFIRLGNKLGSSVGACYLEGAALGLDAGIMCLKELGLTDGCSRLSGFADQNWNGGDCRNLCIESILFGDPPNDPEPPCPFNDCYQCYTDTTKLTFEVYGGRTARTSAFRSPLVYPCEDLPPPTLDQPDIFLQDPCSERR